MNQTYVYKNLFNMNKVFIELVQPKIAMKILKKYWEKNLFVVSLEQIVYFQEQEVSHHILIILI